MAVSQTAHVMLVMRRSRVLICHLRAVCGVTWILLAYKDCAICHTKLWNIWCGAGPQFKYCNTAWVTCGFVTARPHWLDSSNSFLTIFCFMKEINSISCAVIARDPAVAILEKREPEPQGVMWSAPGGERCWVISSKIAEFWYYASIPCLMYIYIYCKNIQNWL